MTDAIKTDSVSSPAATPSEPATTATPAAPAVTASPAESGTAPEIAVAPADAVAMGKVQAAVGAMGTSRYAVLIGGLGFAAGIGLLAGSLGVMGVGHLFAAPSKAPEPWSGVAEQTRALKQSVAKLEAQLAGLKASIEASNRQASTQRSQIAARYEQSAKTQSETQAQLGRISDVVERLEKRVAAAAAAEATGSVAPKHAAAAAAAAPAAVEPPPEKPAVVQDWSIRGVFRGRVLVANRQGVFEAAPGLHLPGLGRVEEVTRENGRWVVVTEKGIITAMSRSRRGGDLLD